MSSPSFVSRPSVAAAVLGVLALCGASASLAKDVVIHAGHLIDGVSKVPREHVSILIHDDRITGVQDGFTTPAGAEVIDLSNATVLPGLIDCHDHVTMQSDGGNPVAEAVTGSSLDEVLKATLYARRTLEAGFTSIRNVGVKIAFGTDEGIAPHGQNAREFALMVKAGMTPMDAILAATGNAADLIGAKQDIGSVQTGRFADIVAVAGNPLSDITELERVQFVMKGGEVYKLNGAILPPKS